jgi:hypothetical protein
LRPKQTKQKEIKMTRQHELYDFVRPRTECPNSVWRVIEIDYTKNRFNAELRQSELEPCEIRRIEPGFDFFISLEEDEE